MRARWWIGLACAAMLCGCAAHSKPRSRPEAPTAAEDEQSMREALEDYAQAKREMVVPRAENDCQTVCRIAELICDASERICSIAARHSGEASYASSCKRAEEDCRTSRGDCEMCQ